MPPLYFIYNKNKKIKISYKIYSNFNKVKITYGIPNKLNSSIPMIFDLRSGHLESLSP